MKLYHTTEKMINVKHPESMKSSEDWTAEQTDNEWHQKQIWWWGEIDGKTYVSLSDGYKTSYNDVNETNFTKSNTTGVKAVKAKWTNITEDQQAYFLDIS